MIFLRGMTSLPRIALGVLSMLLMQGAQAQGGIRVTPWNYEPLFEGPSGWAAQYGIGYDRDLNEGLSLNVGFLLVSEGGWMATYRSAFHVSDNDASSFYLGPTVALRSVAEHGGEMVFPVGMRFGVRAAWSVSTGTCTQVCTSIWAQERGG